MLNSIRKILMKLDPTLKPAKVSENLHEPLKEPGITEIPVDKGKSGS